MQITILGSGTSHGVPMIGCDCKVCTSRNSKNRRTRASAFVEAEGINILIDTATEFRIQAIREGITRIDAVLITHVHADHVHGLDDIRPLTTRSAVPLYGSPAAIEEILRRFDYIFKQTQIGGGKPQIRLESQEPGTFKIGSVFVTPIPLKHGFLDIYGYRIGNFAYLTDCSAIPEESYRLLEGVSVLVIDALRYEPHPTHFGVTQAVEAAQRINPERTFFTHISHRLEHVTLSKELPPGFSPAFDGLSFTL